MGNLLEKLIGQLDTLVPFLAISRKEVFELIGAQWDSWVPDGGESGLPSSYEVYRTQITHSAFLLGYSYVEAFLTDLVREIYRSRPTMLPEEKQLKYEEILAGPDLESVLDRMINKEIAALFYGPMREIVQYFERKLGLTWGGETAREAILASLLRNCIMHNLSRANSRLADVSEYAVDAEIRLTASQVHEFGFAARDSAQSLYEQAVAKHLRL